MNAPGKEHPEKTPWFLWPLVPLVLAATLVVFIPLWILALLSIPYYALYPDHHKHLYDMQGTPRQRELLAKWRSRYARLSFAQRVGRCLKRWRRWRRIAREAGPGR